MKQCPMCQKWTLDYDTYFGRYRCFNSDCEWMPSSSAEREIKLLESYQEPIIVDRGEVPELGLSITVTYDKVNDVLDFDFGLGEATFDLPEPDGRLIWKIAHRTRTAVGFAILEAKELGVSEVQVNIAARKENIEQNLKTVPEAFSSGRPTRMLITSVAITAESEQAQAPSSAFQQAIEKFESKFCQI